MAKVAKPKKEISMEEALWKSADKLRGSVEPAEYKHVVLSLFFLKFASDKFQDCRNRIIANHGERFADMKPFYAQENVFYLPEESRWSYIMENAKQDDIALKIDTALYTIEKVNPALKGALPDNYYSRLHIDTNKLASLLDEIDKINTDDSENDIIGRIYEYFLGKFALAEGKGKGEFYTPKCIVNLIAELIEPYDGILYDPCCGSGGMFVQSIRFVEAHSGNKKKVSIYGQEYTNTTYKLAKMNLAIRGISANLGEMAANTFTNDQHKDLKADYIMANPPFNQKEWRADNELIDETARQLGIDIDTIRKASQEKSSSFAYSLNNGPLVLPINDQVYATQAKIIKHLAEKEDCIIVNGCANYILEDYPHVLRIFVYAPLESRIERVEKDYKEEHENTKKYVQKRDKQRKSYYNYYTTNTWANMKDYDLCINSDMGIDEIAQLIVKVYQNGKLWK